MSPLRRRPGGGCEGSEPKSPVQLRLTAEEKARLVRVARETLDDDGRGMTLGYFLYEAALAAAEASEPLPERDPDLARIVDAWPGLRDADRAVLLGMVSRLKG